MAFILSITALLVKPCGWIICARVYYKDEELGLRVMLADASPKQICASFSSEVATFFARLLEVGKTFTSSGGFIRSTNCWCGRHMHPFELAFDRNAAIIQLPTMDEVAVACSSAAALLPISELSTHRGAWAICAQVCSMAPIRLFDSGRFGRWPSPRDGAC